MKRFYSILMILVVVCFSLLGCQFMGNYSDDGDEVSPAAPPSLADQTGFTSEELQMIGSFLASDKTSLPLPMEVPAMSFYRFDLKNEKGANRVATIISYADATATASPTYGPESTAKVYLYEAKKQQVGHDFDYFTFEKGLTDEVVNNVVKAMLPYLSDPEFLLNSSQNLDEVPAVATVVAQIIAGLPSPAQAEFKATSTGVGSITLDLQPRFQSLGADTLLKLLFNSDLQKFYTLLREFDPNDSPLLKSNVPLKNPLLASRVSHSGEIRGYSTEALVSCWFLLQYFGVDRTLTFNGNGSDSGTPPETYRDRPYFCGGYGYYNLPGNPGNLTKAGYNFDGWDLLGTWNAGGIYKSNNSYFRWNAALSYIFDARWVKKGDPLTPTPIKVYYLNSDATGGGGPVDLREYTTKENVTILGSGNLVRKGFDFAGWIPMRFYRDNNELVYDAAYDCEWFQYEVSPKSPADVSNQLLDVKKRFPGGNWYTPGPDRNSSTFSNMEKFETAFGSVSNVSAKLTAS
ncbi:MAG: InlB B-repeat-containing protein, partial [Candidatus Riflebacteria bacterium]|nr:InlB B-repeat-containing protein [Candidatus Riflebacteria bacterium]